MAKTVLGEDDVGSAVLQEVRKSLNALLTLLEDAGVTDIATLKAAIAAEDSGVYKVDVNPVSELPFGPPK